MYLEIKDSAAFFFGGGGGGGGGSGFITSILISDNDKQLQPNKETARWLCWRGMTS